VHGLVPELLVPRHRQLGPPGRQRSARQARHATPYTFRLDTAAGQAHGNNFHDSFNGTNFTWQVVTASGKPAGAGSPAPAPSYSYQAGY
jgi:hypothetical protein